VPNTQTDTQTTLRATSVAIGHSAGDAAYEVNHVNNEHIAKKN